MIRSRFVAIVAGLMVVSALALLGSAVSGPRIAARLSDRAETSIAEAGGAGVSADFSLGGWPSRHPLLRGGESLDDATRGRIARNVAGIPGVGGIRWADGTALASGTEEAQPPLHCQEDVDALLRARTIRFEESSARVDATSRELIDEVAEALRPCLGSIIAVTGHTDTSGSVPGNLELSRERAEAVRQALIGRGIPADGLRARGVGSAEPVEGLDPADPANRRIEFSVIAKVPILPTAVDTPGPY